jgi:hypothetical protein
MAFLLCPSLPALAETWTTVYQNDFASDPGWVTDNPQDYYWDSNMQAYFARVRNDSPAYHPNRYFYTLLPDGLASFNLSWDAKVTRDEWSSCVNFGVSDSNLKGINGGIGQNICVNFGQSDVGRWFAIDASGASGEAHAEGPYNAWSVNTWYTCDLVYNAHTSTARLTLEETGAKTLICTVNLLVPGGFTSDLKYLGGSRNRAGDSGYVGWSQWAVDEAYIDNVVLQTPEPATLSLLALGGLALLRRRGRIATRPV